MSGAAARRRPTGEGSPKRPLNLSIRADLIDEAKALGTNISAVLETALEDENRRRRAERWRAENAAAINAWNDWVEENGLPLAGRRPW